MAYKALEWHERKKAEQLWRRRGKLWRTLAQYDGLTVPQLSKLSGVSRNYIYYELGFYAEWSRPMSGIRVHKRLWYAEGVTPAWKEALNLA